MCINKRSYYEVNVRHKFRARGKLDCKCLHAGDADNCVSLSGKHFYHIKNAKLKGFVFLSARVLDASKGKKSLD